MAILHPIDPGKLGRHQLYCGPAALCAITGMKGHEAVERVNELRGRKAAAPVGSMVTDELRSVLHGCGYRSSAYVFNGAGETLGRTIPKLDVDRPHVILVTNHFVAVCGDELEDNNHLAPINVREYRGLRKRVQLIVDVLD